MKTTLLKLVQDTLRGMNSDTITSVADTEESRQVALIAKEVYEYLEVVREWPHKFQPIQLVQTDVGVSPIEVKIPDGVSQILNLRYKLPVNPDDLGDGYCYKKLTYLNPEEFLEKAKCIDTDSNIETVNFYSADDPATFPDPWSDSYRIGILDDKEPEYWTRIDDNRVFFDSYNSDRQAAIDYEDVQADGYVLYSFDETNDAEDVQIPDRDWVLYKNLIKSKAWEDIKSAPNTNASQIARRLMIRAQKERNHVTKRTRTGVNYGRT